jgi:hypothetical protein
MNQRTSLVSLLLAAVVLAAGCGSAASQTAAPARPATPLSLATSLTTATGTWAAAVMGGSAASHNNFWQLFVRPAGTSTWRLATPPGVASNGGLVLAGLSSGSMLAGFRPSQDLTYSPLATSKNDGKSWSPSLLDASLADLPGALAAAPGDGGLLALLTDGSTEISSPLGRPWARLATRQVLATSPAGTRCRPGSLTAAAFSPSGQPMLGAACGRPGTAGILTLIGGRWQLTGPAMPAAFAHQAITVIRLSTTGRTTTALLAAGTGRAAHLLAAWSRDGGRHWTLSPSLPLNGAALTSTSSGPGHSLAVTMTRGHAAVIASAADAWRPLPTLPPGTATLASSPSGGWDALAARGTQLTIWQAAPGTQAWVSTQVLKVPVPYGSSG